MDKDAPPSGLQDGRAQYEAPVSDGGGSSWPSVNVRSIASVQARWAGQSDEDDPLRAARGIFTVIAAGGVFWLIVAVITWGVLH